MSTERAPLSDAPEVVPHELHHVAATLPGNSNTFKINPDSQHPSDTAKIAIQEGEQGTGKIKAEESQDAGKEVAGHANAVGILTEANISRRKWWVRRWVWITIVILVIIVVGAVTGAVLGTRATSRVQTSAPESICQGTHCPQVLAAVPYDQGFYALARGDDEAIWARHYYGSAWAPRWNNLGGRFLGQPGAVAWAPDNRINTLAPLSPEGNISSIRYSSGVWSPGSWKIMKKPIGSPVATCITQRNGTQQADIWVRSPAGDNRGILHSWFDYEANKYTIETEDWDAHPGGDAASMPAVVCHDRNTKYDLVIYNRDSGSVQHNQYLNDSDTWTGWNDRGGSFVGNPALISFEHDQFDFFGTGADSAIHHFKWTRSAGYTLLESLGGNFQSDPSAVALSSTRIDVIALGTDNRLKHKALISGAWSQDWEDIGGDTSVNSAPLLRTFGAEPVQVGILVIGANDDLMFAAWNLSQDESWSSLSTFESVGGSLTTGWFDAW